MSLTEAKRAVHTSPVFGSLIGREKQSKLVFDFIHGHINHKASGSLYITGAPGVGKTAVITQVLDEISRFKASMKGFTYKSAVINCMMTKNSKDFLELLRCKLKLGKKDDVWAKMASLNQKTTMIILVLDEMDHLTQKQFGSLMHDLFKVSAGCSKLILIGIANTLDLTAKTANFMPTVPLRTPVDYYDCKHCYVLNFPPYEREDIEKILTDRLSIMGNGILTPEAIKFLSAKVASSTGDVRTALLAAREALDNASSKPLGSPEGGKENATVANPPVAEPDYRGSVGVLTVSKIIGTQKCKSQPPLHHSLIMCTLSKMIRSDASLGSSQGISVEKLFSEYRALCLQQGIQAHEKSEITSMVEVLAGGEKLRLRQKSTPSFLKKKRAKMMGLINSASESEIFCDSNTIADFLKNSKLPFSF